MTTPTTAIPITTIEQKQALRLRHELKYTITWQDGAALSARLQKLFARDAYAGPDGCYQVNSCYFDTPGDTALRQKLDGVNRREKFRLRYYGQDTSFIRLEKKFKINGLCGKHSARLTRQQAQRILCGDTAFLLQSGHPLLVEFYSKLQGGLLRPKTMVSYRREAFVYGPGNVRVTIDSNLHTGLGSTAFFTPAALGRAPASDGLALLEVKYDAFLPQVVAMAVQTPGRRAAAYSKYAACRRYD